MFIAKAHELFADIEYISFTEAAGRALGFDGDEFDVVVVHTTLCNVPEANRLFAEAAHVLRPLDRWQHSTEIRQQRLLQLVTLVHSNHVWARFSADSSATNDSCGHYLTWSRLLDWSSSRCVVTATLRLQRVVIS